MRDVPFFLQELLFIPQKFGSTHQTGQEHPMCRLSHVTCIHGDEGLIFGARTQSVDSSRKLGLVAENAIEIIEVQCARRR
jgi:hypothetical protein